MSHELLRNLFITAARLALADGISGEDLHDWLGAIAPPAPPSPALRDRAEHALRALQRAGLEMFDLPDERDQIVSLWLESLDETSGFVLAQVLVSAQLALAEERLRQVPAQLAQAGDQAQLAVAAELARALGHEVTTPPLPVVPALAIRLVEVSVCADQHRALTARVAEMAARPPTGAPPEGWPPGWTDQGRANHPRPDDAFDGYPYLHGQVGGGPQALVSGPRRDDRADAVEDLRQVAWVLHARCEQVPPVTMPRDSTEYRDALAEHQAQPLLGLYRPWRGRPDELAAQLTALDPDELEQIRAGFRIPRGRGLVDRLTTHILRMSADMRVGA